MTDPRGLLVIETLCPAVSRYTCECIAFNPIQSRATWESLRKDNPFIREDDPPALDEWVWIERNDYVNLGLFRRALSANVEWLTSDALDRYFR